MLPIELQHEPIMFHNDDDWYKYLSSIGSYADSIDHDFLSQICYEHYDRFNEWFPSFNIQTNRIVRAHISTVEIYESIRYDDNERIDFWDLHVDNYFAGEKIPGYIVLEHCCEHGTWPFPPVVTRHETGIAMGTSKVLGHPIHLIEGTHRVSYINRLYELEKIDGDAVHEILFVE